MESKIWLAGVILVLIIILLLLKIYRMRRAMREIRTELADCLTQETNTLIDVSCNDREVRWLAAGIDEQLRILRAKRRHFQSGNAELRDAVTNISHDLRTPLTAICGYLDLLKQEDKSLTAERYIELIENRTDALCSLTEELFQFSVTMSSEEKQDAGPVNLCAALEESVAAYYAALKGCGINPAISLPEDRVERRLDKAALARIFGNIISNAMKYSDGDLVIEMDRSGTIVFSNTAVRLDPVMAGKLFDRFFTVETGRGSTGLGLSIARLLTDRMGGTIRAEYKDTRLYIILSFPD